MRKKKGISIIIPAFNRIGLLERCLRSISKSDYKDYSILVVDDGSSEDLRPLCRRYKTGYLRIDSPKGAGNARTKGAEISEGRYLLFVDSDVELRKETLSNMMKNFGRYPDNPLMCGFKSQKVISGGFSEKVVQFRKTFRKLPKAIDGKYVLNSFIESAFFAIERDAFFSLGGFSREWKRSGVEEHEFGHRIARVHEIRFFRNLEVDHNFEDMGTHMKKVLFRSFSFSRLFLRDRRTEKRNVATKGDFLASSFSLAFFISLVFGIYRDIWFIAAAIFLIPYMALRRDHLIAALRKGPVFFSAFLPFDMASCALQAAGGISGLLYHGAYMPFLSWTRLFFSRTPRNIGLFVTSRCNLACSHCFYWKEILKSKSRKELNLDEIDLITQKMDKVFFLTITGGEPTLREDLPEICRLFYIRNGTRVFSYHTNGFLTDKVLEQVRKIALDCPEATVHVGVSLDGFKDYHDSCRGKQGSWDQCIKTVLAVKSLRKIFRNIDIQSCGTITKENISQCLEFSRFMTKEHGINQGWTFVRGDHRKRDIDVDPEDYMSMYRKLYHDIQDIKHRNWAIRFVRNFVGTDVPKNVYKAAKYKKQPIPCRALKDTVVISDIGDVYPCEMLGERIANLRDNEYDLNRILASKRARKIRDSIRLGRCYCTHEGNMYVNLICNKKVLISSALKRIWRREG